MTTEEPYVAIDAVTDSANNRTPGGVLAIKREARGLSQKDVAEQLRLLPRQVIALEENRFDEFNGDIFSKGYLRSYARLLGADSEELIALFDEYYKSKGGGTGNLATQNARSFHNLPAQHASKRRYLGVVASIFVVVVLWLFNREGLSGIDKPDANLAQSSDLDTVVIDPNVLALPPQKNHQERDDELTPAEFESSELSASEPLAIEAESAIVGNGIDNLTDEAVRVPEQVEPAPVVRVDPVNGVEQLSFSFSGDCWVEVEDADGMVLIADLKRANERVELTGVPPFKILLGNATVVSLNYNGNKVEINPDARNQSARFSVDRS